MNIEYPVRLTAEYQIMDANNKVVVPELTWRNDAVHLNQQKEIGELIEELINRHGIEMAVRLEESPIFEAEVEKRGRGRPRKA